MHFAQGILILDTAEHLKDKWILLEQSEIIFFVSTFCREFEFRGNGLILVLVQSSLAELVGKNVAFINWY